MLVREAFGQVLSTLRREAGLSQEDLGLRSGYHRTYVSLLERGQRGPSLEAVLRLASCLDVPGWDVVRRVEGGLRRSGGKGSVGCAQ